MTAAPALVQKFGGTSVSTPERRQMVVEHVRRARRDGYRVAIVVSAMGRRGDPYATDTLLDLLRADGGPVDEADYDLIFVPGEIISVAVMSHTLKRAGIPAIGLTGIQAGVRTDGHHREAEIISIDTTRLERLMERGEVPVVTGGQGGARDTLDFTTLGRGASDTSGVALGVALGASKVEIFTDVQGVAFTDPRIVPEAPWLDKIGYGKMHEMARFGAKVLHPRAILAGWNGCTPIIVRSTFSMHPGTFIGDLADQLSVAGIATLSPLETVVLARDAVGAEQRQLWERRLLIMSMVDSDTGAMVAGISPDRARELEDALRQAEVAPVRRLGPRAWVSLIGETEVLRRREPKDRDCLKDAQIDVSCRESADMRTTYVVEAEAMGRAVTALYRNIVSGALG
jgi:aspartate kinase